MPTSELARMPKLALSGGGRRLDATLRRDQVPGQRAAAAIESAALATHVALSHTAMLSGAEGRALQYAPLGDARYKAIVDTFAGVCCEKIAALGRQ